MIIRTYRNRPLPQFIKYSKKSAKGWGNFTIVEHHLIDFLVCIAQSQGNLKEEYDISMDELMSRYESLNGTNRKVIRDGLQHIREKKFILFKNRSEKKNSKKDEEDLFKPISVFSKLIKTESGYCYSFTNDFRTVIFNLSDENSYKLDLFMADKIRSKNALILLKLWSSKKSDNASVKLQASAIIWEQILGLSNASYGRINQEVKRAIKILDNLFGSRYFFSSFSNIHKKRLLNYNVIIFGDNTTSYPILNKEDDFGNGEDIEFLHDRNFEENKSKLYNYFGIKYLNEKVRDVRSLNLNEIDKLTE